MDPERPLCALLAYWGPLLPSGGCTPAACSARLPLQPGRHTLKPLPCALHSSRTLTALQAQALSLLVRLSCRKACCEARIITAGIVAASSPPGSIMHHSTDS